MNSTGSVKVKKEDIKARALLGVKALILRSVLSQGIRIISVLVLSRLLFPQDYGIFGVTAYITGLGMFLGDVGLGASLVRQDRDPGEDELLTIFLIQQALTLVFVGFLIGFAPFLLTVYKLAHSALPLFILMGLSLFFSSLGGVPTILLERDLRFGAIARCELLAHVVMTSTTILLAWRGCGAWAMVGGNMARGAVNLALLWRLSGYTPKGRFRLSILRPLLRFGLPYQLNALVPALLGGWTPFIVSRLGGAASLGLVNWAINISSAPLMLSGVLYRIGFPAYSRLQSDPAALEAYLLATVRRVNDIFWLLIPIGIILLPSALPILFGARWIPAISLVQWFLLDAYVQTQTTVLASAQNATGHALERLFVAISTGILRWIVGYAAMFLGGVAGIGPAVLGVSFCELAITLYLIQKRSSDRTLAYICFYPMLTMSLLLIVALYAGNRVSVYGSTSTMLVSLLVFVSIVVVKEVYSSGQGRLRNFYTTVKMLRSG